jgi:hypothetical protein
MKPKHHRRLDYTLGINNTSRQSFFGNKHDLLKVDPLDKILHPNNRLLKETNSEKGTSTMLKGFKRSKSTITFFKNLDKASSSNNE